VVHELTTWYQDEHVWLARLEGQPHLCIRSWRLSALCSALRLWRTRWLDDLARCRRKDSPQIVSCAVGRKSHWFVPRYQPRSRKKHPAYVLYHTSRATYNIIFHIRTVLGQSNQRLLRLWWPKRYVWPLFGIWFNPLKRPIFRALGLRQLVSILVWIIRARVASFTTHLQADEWTRIIILKVRSAITGQVGQLVWHRWKLLAQSCLDKHQLFGPKVSYIIFQNEFRIDHITELSVSTAVFGALIQPNSTSYTKILDTTSFIICIECTTDKVQSLRITLQTMEKEKGKLRLLVGARWLY